jgi:hypothetical protein
LGDPVGGSIRDALDLLERLRQAAEADARMGAVIEARLLQALALDTQGDRRAARLALDAALTLAAPEGYVRLFVDEGAPMAELPPALMISESTGKKSHSVQRNSSIVHRQPIQLTSQTRSGSTR